MEGQQKNKILDTLWWFDNKVTKKKTKKKKHDIPKVSYKDLLIIYGRTTTERFIIGSDNIFKIDALLLMSECECLVSHNRSVKTMM